MSASKPELITGYCLECGAAQAPLSDPRNVCVPCDIDHTYYLLNHTTSGNFWDSIREDEFQETIIHLNTHLTALRKLRTKHRAQGSYPGEPC